MKEKRRYFCTAYFVGGIFFNICVLSPCIVYSFFLSVCTEYTFKIYILLHIKKTLLNTLLLLLFLKSPKAFSTSSSNQPVSVFVNSLFVNFASFLLIPRVNVLEAAIGGGCPVKKIR